MHHTAWLEISYIIWYEIDKDIQKHSYAISTRTNKEAIRRTLKNCQMTFRQGEVIVNIELKHFNREHQRCQHRKMIRYQKEISQVRRLNIILKEVQQDMPFKKGKE
ncbi:hypothetical protein pb186bvf_005351 [Paramecium bursaria]